MNSALGLLFLLFVALPPIRGWPAALGQRQLSEDNQRIVDVKLKEGVVLSDSLIIYPNGNSWWLPLGQLAEVLGIAITPFTTAGKAEGTILSERRTFKLDAGKCTAEIERKISQFVCEQVTVFENDFYVDLGLLQKWLPVDFEFDTFSSSLVVQARERLPIQEALERERRAKNLKALNASFDPGFPRLSTPNAVAEGPFLDQQVTYTHQDKQGELQHDTVAAGEILGFAATLYARGDSKSVDQVRGNLAKKDPEGNLLGPLRVRSLEFIDINVPTLPIVGGGGFGRGALISSFPLQSPTDYGSETLQGPLPTGWEVEIYQNDTLVGREASGESGRYEFKNIPLYYGINRFHLIFYGPQGQRREEYKTYNIDPSLQKPGGRDFRLAYADLENKGGDRAVAQIDQNLFAPLTARLSTAALTPAKDIDRRAYHTLSLIGGHGPVLATATGTVTDFGGSAQEYGVRVPLSRITLGVKRTRLDKFHSDLYILDPNRDIYQSTDASIAAVVLSNPALRLTLDGTEDLYTNGDIQRHLLHRTSLLTGLILWNNELDIQDGASNSFQGLFSSNLLLTKSQIRLESKYDRDKILSAGAELQHRFAERYTGRFGINQIFANDLTTYSLMINRTLKKISVSGNLGYNSEGDFSVGATLSYSFAHDPVSGQWLMDGQPQAGSGAASVLVYDDRNRNQQFDTGDLPMSGIPIQSPQKELDLKTDADGRAFMTQLAPYQPFDLAVSAKGIENPFKKPVQKGLRFMPRPGKTATVEFPVQTFSEISGVLNYRNHFKKGISVELIDKDGKTVATTLTESDGFYAFDYIAPGAYTIRIDPKYVSEKKIKVTPPSISFSAPDDGTSDSGFDFAVN